MIFIIKVQILVVEQNIGNFVRWTFDTVKVIVR